MSATFTEKSEFKSVHITNLKELEKLVDGISTVTAGKLYRGHISYKTKTNDISFSFGTFKELEDFINDNPEVKEPSWLTLTI